MNTSVKTDLATSLLALDDLPAACDIEQALDHMRAHHLSQLWVCGGLHIDCSADALARARRAGWDIRISPPRGGGVPDPEQPAAHDDWLICYRVGEYTPAGYSLVFPARDPRHIWPFDDAQTLTAALRRYARALGLPYYRTPQTTAGRLLRSLHSGAHATALETPAAMPPIAGKDAGADLQDVPLMWRRAVTPDELDAAPYLISFDVNAQFLRAASGLPLGFGEVTHLTGAMAEGFTQTAAQRGPDKGRWLIPPGYYRVCYANPRSALFALAMPHPLYRAGFADRPCSPPGAWVSAPTVRLLIELGIVFICTEAYLWREHHRFLDPWYKRLAAARSELLADDSPAATLALDALKQTYSHFFGNLARESKSDKDALKRPDWRHADIAEARALHYRNMLKAVDLGYWPVLVTEDTLGFLVETRDPAAAAVTLGLKLSTTPGHYKLKDCVDVRAPGLAQDVRAALLDTQMAAKDMQSLLARVRREQREGGAA